MSANDASKPTVVAATLVAVVLVALGVRLYSSPPDDDPVVLPAVLALDAQPSDTLPTDTLPSDALPSDTAPTETLPTDALPTEPLTPADQVIAQISSGDIDLVGVMTVDGSDAEFDAFEQVIGRSPDVVQISIGWELDDFDPDILTRGAERGALLSISWEPWDYRPTSVDQPEYALARILAGDYDAYIDEWAAGLASTEQPILLRFAHEANGEWYPWAESQNGNQPGEYVAVWRYVHDRFTQAGADNVIWMWSPNINPFGTYPMASGFPGDEYIDLVGLVGYWGHFGVTPTEPGSFESVFGISIAEIRTLTQKPILIAETGASDEGGFKALWIRDFLAEVAARRDIVGFIWFEAVKEDNWRVDSTPESLAVFLEGLAQPAFAR